MTRQADNGLSVVSCREVLDVIEGTSLLVDPVELQSLPAVRVHDLPPGFVAHRLRADCVLIGFQDARGTWALRINSCSIKPKHVEMLADRKPEASQESDQ